MGLLQPDLASAQLNLGNVLRRQGHIGQSAEHLRQAPTLELGECAAAIRAFEQVVEVSPAQPAAYANFAATDEARFEPLTERRIRLIPQPQPS